MKTIKTLFVILFFAVLSAYVNNKNMTVNIEIESNIPDLNTSVYGEGWEQSLLGEYFVQSRMKGDSIREYLRVIEGTNAYELISTHYMSDEFFDYETMLFVSEFINGEYKCVNSFIIPERRENANGGLILMDVDFDGIKDVLVWLGHEGNQGVIRYSAFLHRGDSFIESNFDGIPSPVVDSRNKKIGGTIRNWAVSHNMYIYTFVDGCYVVTDSFTIELCLDTDELKYIVTLRDGNKVNEVYWDATDRMQIEALFYDEDSSWGIDSSRWQSPYDLHKQIIK